MKSKILDLQDISKYLGKLDRIHVLGVKIIFKTILHFHSRNLSLNLHNTSQLKSHLSFYVAIARLAFFCLFLLLVKNGVLALSSIFPCSHNGTYECPGRCSPEHQQCQEERQTPGSHQVVLQGHCLVSNRDDKVWLHWRI